MSGTEETTRTRKERRGRERRSVREQRFAQLMMRVYEEGKLRRHEGEPEGDYYARLRDKALRIQRYQRKAKRTTARAARKRNRR